MTWRIIIFDCVICINTLLHVRRTTFSIFTPFSIMIISEYKNHAKKLSKTAIMSYTCYVNEEHEHRTRKSKPFEIESRTKGKYSDMFWLMFIFGPWSNFFLLIFRGNERSSR